MGKFKIIRTIWNPLPEGSEDRRFPRSIPDHRSGADERSDSDEGGRVRKANACKSNVREARATRRDVGGRLTSENRSAPPDAAHAPYLKEHTPALASPFESPSARAATPPILPLNRVDFIFFDENSATLSFLASLAPSCPYYTYMSTFTLSISIYTPFYLRRDNTSSD